MSLIPLDASCPRGALADSLAHTNCQVNWKDITRVVFFVTGGTNPFIGTDAETQKTEVETKTAWDTAIALADTGKIFMSPRCQNADLVPGEAQFEDLPNGDRYFSDFLASNHTITLHGLTAADESALRRISGTGLSVGFIQKDGKAILKKATALGTGDLFFPTQSVAVGGRANTTGNVSDRVVINITYEDGALDGWEVYDTEAFGLII